MRAGSHYTGSCIGALDRAGGRTKKVGTADPDKAPLPRAAGFPWRSSKGVFSGRDSSRARAAALVLAGVRQEIKPEDVIAITEANDLETAPRARPRARCSSITIRRHPRGYSRPASFFSLGSRWMYTRGKAAAPATGEAFISKDFLLILCRILL